MIEKVQTRPGDYPRSPKRIALNLTPRNLPLSLFTGRVTCKDGDSGEIVSEIDYGAISQSVTAKPWSDTLRTRSAI